MYIYIYILHTVFSGFSWGYHIIPNRLINLNNGETTVKLAAQNPFRSEPQCCRTLLSYMCVLCEVLLHPPQVSRLRRGCHNTGRGF